MIASEFMTSNVISCRKNQTVGEAAKIMLEKGFSVMPITDENDSLVGVITESDFIGKMVDVPHAMASVKQLLGQTFNCKDIESVYSQAKTKQLSDVMTKDPVTISPSTSLTDIVELMVSKNLKRLLVMKDERIVGIITRKDLLKAFNLVQ